jgi:hypothetical protein
MNIIYVLNKVRLGVTRWRAGQPRLDSSQALGSPHYCIQTRSVGPTHPRFWWVPSIHSTCVKWSRREADHSPPIRKVNLPLWYSFYLNTTPWRRIGEWRYSSTHYLTAALDGGEWSASCPGRFNAREKLPWTNWIGGWVGHSRSGRGGEEKNSQSSPGVEN